MNSLIDRRLNGRNKSAVNRERFLRRYKDQIRKAVHGMIRDRSIQDMDQGGEINLPARDISEPTFRHGAGGDREMVHPGNREFAKGDTFDRPQGEKARAAPNPARARRSISSPSACRGPNSSTCSSKTWNCLTWRAPSWARSARRNGNAPAIPLPARPACSASAAR